MQTFLPYPDFKKSVKSLDFRRLGKQRVEAKQILNALEGKTKGWRNHPATLMWAANIDALKLYMNECILEWTSRGYKNTMELAEVPENVDMPYWFGDDRLHSSHRSNLLRKDLNYYSKFGWSESPEMEYLWPVRK